MTHSDDNEAELKADVALANRILVAHGVLDAFGHVSVRSQRDPDQFLLSRNLAPALVKSTDIQRFSLDGSTDDVRRPYLERFIHGAIYAARPDVNAVVHSHASAVLPFTVTSTPLRALIHTAGFLARSAPNFDVRDHRGDGTNLLVTDGALGAAVAAALGNEAVLLMRGHGFVSAGTSLPIAVSQSIFTIVNARVLMEGLKLGDPVYLTPAEGEAAEAAIRSQVDRAWSVWVKNVESDSSDSSA